MQKRNLLLCLIALTGWLMGFAADGADVTLELTSNNRAATLRNGIVMVYVNADGVFESFKLKDPSGIEANDIQLMNKNSTETRNKVARGYLSYTSGNTNGELDATETKVITNTTDMVEVQFIRKDESTGLQWTLGYILRRGDCGCYNYAIVKALRDTRIDEARFGMRIQPDFFNYAYVNDNQQGLMPSPAEMMASEEVSDATYKLSDGSIYTKYDYATFMADNNFHGIMGDQLGVWFITPSHEWLNGGVGRQELTLHATNQAPFLIQHFQGNHLGGATTYLGVNKEKLYGPYFIYVNRSDQSSADAAHAEMIADAKARSEEEMAAWPYSWFSNALYPTSRGSVTGTLTISDPDYFHTDKFQVVLAQTGSKPILQSDGYQFWAETDDEGSFTIGNVRPGSYSLWAYALNGSATGYFEQRNIEVTAGGNNDVGTLTWSPVRYDNILWQIGETDHLAEGFQLSDLPRQFELWKKVPASLTYTIGTSTDDDWYYAQPKGATWLIKYNLDYLPSKPLHLTIATAGAAGSTENKASLKCLTSNGRTKYEFPDGIRQLHDGSVIRSATLAGRDSLYTFEIPAAQLVKGENTLSINVWEGNLMYDCIKLEAEEPLTFYNTVHRTALPAVSYGSNYQLQGEGIKMTLSAENWTRENYQTSWGDFSSEDFPQVAGCGITPLSADDQRCNTANNKLPAKGAYSIFEPEHDGILKVYGRFNYDTYLVNADWSSEQKKNFSGAPWTSVEFQVRKGQKYYCWCDNFAARFCGFDFTPMESLPTGISELSTPSLSAAHDVYDLTGRKVLSSMSSSAALRQLKSGVYIINGKKVLIE